MQDKEYMFIKPDGTWATRRTLKQVMEAARNQIPKKRLPVLRYVLKKDDKQLRRGLRKYILNGLEKNLKEGNVGPTYRIWGNGKVQFVARESTPVFKILPTNGNKKADKAWSYGKGEFPDCRFLGAYVCKHIVGSYTMSQHSYGNAVDFGRDSMDELYDLAYFLLDHAADLDLQHVIVDDRIWTRGVGWSHYSGDRHYHVHVDFYPQYSGSCGVRG